MINGSGGHRLFNHSNNRSTVGEMRSINDSTSESDLFGLNMTVRDDSPYTPHKVDKLKRHLRFHFMTPCEKYKARRRKPWKLIVQILKIIVVTVQVFSLGVQRTDFVNFQDKTTRALQHIMLKGWDASYETMPYPAATGKYAIYKIKELTHHLNFAMTKYNVTAQEAIGAYGYPNNSLRESMSKVGQLKLTYFKVGELFPSNVSYDLDPRLDEIYLDFAAMPDENGTEVYDIEKLLGMNYHPLAINKLHKVELSVQLNTIHIKAANTLNPFNEPDCLKINATILYDNSDHNGQMLILMNVDLLPIPCFDGSKYEEDSVLQYALTILLDTVVILLCVVSFVTCFRSVKKSFKLLRKTTKFFLKHYGHECDGDDKILFLNLWYIMIIVADLLTVIGTALKMAITFHEYKYYDYATMLLGISIILTWLGVVRYFEYFKKYNVLVLTCKKALPNVLRFLTCAAIIYIAYTICGWLVLGPYHLKFVSIATSSECLFSLVNGDDMFVTFSVIDDKSPYGIWLFSRVYLYSFISLFIYFVLNVFISVIIDTYEVVKSYYEDGFPKTAVEKFMESCTDPPNSPLYISDVGSSSCCCLLSSCLRREHTDDSTNIIS